MLREELPVKWGGRTGDDIPRECMLNNFDIYLIQYNQQIILMKHYPIHNNRSFFANLERTD